MAEKQVENYTRYMKLDWVKEKRCGKCQKKSVQPFTNFIYDLDYCECIQDFIWDDPDN